MSDALPTTELENDISMMRESRLSHPASLGARLAMSREQKNWTVQFVSDQLKLSTNQILALESDRFEALPKLVIVRGFVRAYAKLLKVDGDALVSMLPQEAPAEHLDTSLRPALSTPFIDSRMSLLAHHDTNRRYIFGAGLLAVVVMVFLFFQHTLVGKGLWDSVMSRASTTVAANASADVNAQALAPEAVSASAPEVSASVTQPVSAPAPSVVAAKDAFANNEMPTTVVENTLADVAKSELPKSGEIKQDQTVAVPAKSDKQSVAASAADANLASLPKGAGLSLKFRQNSWIQVKAENGTILSSHLAKAGTEESFELKQALSVKIGNAAGVDATLRGAAFPIIGERGSNVANLVVK